MDPTQKSLDQLNQLIKNYVDHDKTGLPMYAQLLEERARKSQLTQQLNLEKSIDCLKAAAQQGVCITYGELADASGVEWSKARHQMNGAKGHLDCLLDLCHARGLPLLTAICVNQAGVVTGELEEGALAGFVAGAKRLGLQVTDGLAFHHRCRDECWEWGRHQSAAS